MRHLRVILSFGAFGAAIAVGFALIFGTDLDLVRWAFFGTLSGAFSGLLFVCYCLIIDAVARRSDTKD